MKKNTSSEEEAMNKRRMNYAMFKDDNNNLYNNLYEEEVERNRSTRVSVGIPRKAIFSEKILPSEVLFLAISLKVRSENF